MQHFQTINRDKVRILLTGASGFLGRAILQQLCKENHQILAFARTPLLVEYPSVYWKPVDLNQPSSYQPHLCEFRPEILIHLAWQDIPDFSFSTSLLNLHQSLNLLQIVLKVNCCKKILVAGTCWELNKKKGECFESDLGSPTDHFTWAKHSVRNWLEMETTKLGITFAWMRIFYLYGPRQRKESLLPMLLTELQNMRLPHIKTPYHASDFVFVEDAAKGFVQAVEKEFISGTFHLGSGRSTPVWKLCQIAEEVLCGKKILTEQLLETNLEPIQLENDFWANCERSHKFLGWKPQTTLEGGIKKTLEWLQL